MQGRCPIYLKDYFKPNYKIHTRATRQSKILHVPAVGTEIAKPAVGTEIAKTAFYYPRCTVNNELSKYSFLFLQDE